MTEKYFDKFQIINYANTAARNITQRAVVLNSVYNSPIFYYAYDIQQGERADNISDRYYKDEYMDWILRLTNKVIDPYYDWYLDETTFKDFVAKKYGSYSAAMSKVKYYRNNWYSYPDPIDQVLYDSLDDNLKKFYDPVYSDVYYSTTPLGYKRKQVDWKKTTNNIVRYNCNGASFSADEIVDVYRDNERLGGGQVCAKSNTSLTIQHTSGVVTEDAGVFTFTVRGRESSANQAYTNATLVISNIPATEINYWEPVYAFDYENEINENNKSIQVLKSEYSGQIATELKRLME